MTSFHAGLAAAKLQKQLDELQKQIEVDRVRRLLATTTPAPPKPTAPAKSTDQLLIEAFDHL